MAWFSLMKKLTNRVETEKQEICCSDKMITTWRFESLKSELTHNQSCLFQLAGVVAVEVTGGPTIDFVPGRKVCYSSIF